MIVPNMAIFWYTPPLTSQSLFSKPLTAKKCEMCLCCVNYCDNYCEKICYTLFLNFIYFRMNFWWKVNVFDLILWYVCDVLLVKEIICISYN